MQTAGKILLQKRIEKGLDLKTVEKQTKIRCFYLESLEKEKWENFPSNTYIMGHMRRYAKFLGLNEENVLAVFRRDFEEQNVLKFRGRVPSHYFTPAHVKLLRGGVIILIFCVVLYVYYQFRLFMAVPELSFLEPKTFEFTNEAKIRVVGKTAVDTIVRVNGEQIFPDREGIFSFEQQLPEDVNEFEVLLEGANGKKASVKKTIVRKSTGN